MYIKQILYFCYSFYYNGAVYTYIIKQMCTACFWLARMSDDVILTPNTRSLLVFFQAAELQFLYQVDTAGTSARTYRTDRSIDFTSLCPSVGL